MAANGIRGEGQAHSRTERPTCCMGMRAYVVSNRPRSLGVLSLLRDGHEIAQMTSSTWYAAILSDSFQRKDGKTRTSSCSSVAGYTPHMQEELTSSRTIPRIRL